MLSRTSKRNIALFAAAFLLCGVLHVILWGVDFTYTFSQLFMSILTLLWVLTVQKRVTDARLRKLLLWIAALMILFYVLQIMKYRLFYGFTSVQRYLWYAYYIPVMAISLLCFYLALYIYRPQEKPLPAVSYLPIVIGILLALGVLTNDLHFLAFRFPSGILSDDAEHRNGPLFFLFAFVFLVLFILSYWIILRKCHQTVRGKLRFLPVLPLIAETVYCVLYLLDAAPRINGINLWNGGEFFGFCMIAFLEACIIVGMIPANKNYEKLFFATRLPAVILDSKGSVVYQTAGTKYPFPESGDVKVMRHPISGGSAEWMVDLKQVRSLNQQLEDATAQMEARNAYLAEENRIKQEKAEVETRNRLYDRISGLLKPKLDQIEELLDAPEGDPDRQLARAAVLNAYIKRRSNLELLIAERLDVDELTAAVAESLEYMRLCGVNTAVSSFGAGTFPSEMVIAAYEHIEAIAEESLDTLSDMIVTVRAEGKELIVRMMLKADDFVYAANGQWHDGSSFSRRVVITKDKQDMMILLTFTEGGEQS